MYAVEPKHCKTRESHKNLYGSLSWLNNSVEVLLPQAGKTEPAKDEPFFFAVSEDT